MPTSLPITPQTTRPTVGHTPTLTIGDTIRFFWLLGRSRWLHHRLEAAHRRLDRDKTHAAGDVLLRAAERWLACHEEIGTLLNLPAPPAVDEMRSVLGLLPAQPLPVDRSCRQNEDEPYEGAHRAITVWHPSVMQQGAAKRREQNYKRP